MKGEHAALQLFTQILGGCRGIFFYCNGDVPGFGFFNDKATPPEVREKLTAFFRLVNTHQKEFSLPRAQADIAVLLSNAGHRSTTAAMRTRRSATNTPGGFRRLMT